ncbi:MAG: AAA family ATPase [Lachnospiraceae bacterium]
MENIKINKLEIENVKRVKAVKIEPTKNGLTVIGGKNGQGKTSVLDAIAWALGGDKYRPSKAMRDGSAIPPNLHIVLSNGLVVERKGKNSDLKVLDPNGQKGGQQLLNSFVEQLALDLPKFLESSDKEKAQTLLQIIGVGDKLYELEQEEQTLYNKRLTIGQIAEQKEKFAKEQPYHTDAPKEPVSAADLIKEQQEILARNGENQRKRQNVAFYQDSVQIALRKVSEYQLKLEEVQSQLHKAQEELATTQKDLEISEKSAADLVDESTSELEQSINSIEEINRKVRANLDKDKAEEDALDYKNQYADLTGQINSVRKEKTDLLTNTDLPLPRLSVEDGVLTYNNQKWDNMSGSDRLRVATAIVRKLNPNCGFVVLDKLEQMDLDTLQEFGAWLEQEGLQAIATRVSSGEECSIIIEDGYVQGSEAPVVEETQTVEAPIQKVWKAGEF